MWINKVRLIAITNSFFLLKTSNQRTAWVQPSIIDTYTLFNTHIILVAIECVQIIQYNI